MECEPAIGAGIPCDGEGLEVPPRFFDQKLLEWIDADHIRDLEKVRLAVRARRLDVKSGAVSRESRADGAVVEIDSVKMTQNVRGGRFGESPVVKGSLPAGEGAGMAIAAGLGPCEPVGSGFVFREGFAAAGDQEGGG